MRSGIGHTSPDTRRADRSAFTRVGQQSLEAAAGAANASEATAKLSAAEEAFKFALHVYRVAVAILLLGLGKQRLPVLSDDLVERASLGSSFLVVDLLGADRLNVIACARRLHANAALHEMGHMLSGAVSAAWVC